MSERALLARFDLVADNPENLPLLRHYIVDLAIRGKLLDKSALDISAPKMLERIEAKADSLVKQGKLKKQKLLAPISKEELPATYIAHCAFERLGNVASLQKGLTGIQSAMPGKFPLVVTAAARSTCDHFDFDGAATIIPMVSSTGHGHASLNRLHYQEGKFALGTILCAVFPIDEELVSARFLFEYLTAFKDDLLVSKMNGTANVTLTVGKIAEVPVPIIAPAVQRRVNELMALCDQLQAAQNECEARRDRLVAASLHRIGTAPATANKAESGSEITTPLPEAARFHLAHLPRLTTRPEHIKQLRQTTLNLAVRGRLVPQDHNDEPAAELLNHIQIEKARLVKDGSARKEKSRVPLAADELPFHVPKGWQWSQLAEIGFISPRNDVVGATTASFVPMTLIPADYGIPHKHEVRPWSEIKTGYTHFAEGDVGLAKITPCFENGKSTVFRNLSGGFGAGTTELHVVRPLLVNADYVLLFLKCPHFIESGAPRMTGTAGQKRVPADYFAYSPFPLPPLAEQHRIVAKVDELMALCDQLEAQLTTTQTYSRRLLESVLHEALVI